MADEIPKNMRAVVLEKYQPNVIDAIRGLQVRDRPVPTPGYGQVLIRIEAAPCNPSDLLLLQGRYGTLKTLPTVPGWEGAGQVAASGGGLFARWLVGKRVACALPGDRDGTWAEYFVADATDCIPLKAALPIEQAATFIVNPLTAMALLETARRAGHRAAVHTVGASQLGRMMLNIAADMSYPLIHMVRRNEQAEMLEARGAKYVLNASQEGFAEQLARLAKQLNATAVFEAVAGEMTGMVLNAMPPKSAVYLYGALSEQPCAGIDPVEVIFHEKTLSGFFLRNWLRERGFIGVVRTVAKVQRMLIDKKIETSVQRHLRFDEVIEGLQQYVAHMTDGKVLIFSRSK
ncbi:MAG TPA: zinc-binding dehydrogenase [Lacipirellulaceae bacterium]|jgi:NADPH:quinone reductase-like Zn-dependent oxidoreductase|nr:zinc-binding dehydrogenase [Lacipirellulaceae bacterium]